MIRTRTVKQKDAGGSVVSTYETLQIDLVFKNRDTNAKERYRRNAQVQTREGARSEERKVIGHFEKYGTIQALLTPPEPEKKSEKHTWSDAVELYEAWALDNLKASTRAGYKELLDSPWFAAFAKRDVAELAKDKAHFIKWDAELKKHLGDSRRRNAHIAMRTVFRVAEEQEWHDGLVKFRTEGGKTGKGLPPVPKKTIKATHADDLNAILGESDEGVPERVAADRGATRLAFAIIAYAGLRPSEVRALKWRDVDLRRGEIHVRAGLVVGVEDTCKDEDERDVKIGERLVSILKAAKDARGSVEAEDYVAPTTKGTPMTDKVMYHALRRACDRLGLEKGKVYGLRHFFCTEMAREPGINPKTIADQAGHSTLTITQRYIDSVSKDREKAASVFDAPRFGGLKVLDGGKARKAS